MSAAIRDIVSFLADIFELSLSKSINEGYFQSYLAIGRSLIQLTQQNATTRALGSALTTHLCLFNKAWSMSTGGSMETLWKRFRPSTAESLTQLKAMLAFEALANGFDDLVGRSNASMELLSNMRTSLLRAFESLGTEQPSSTLQVLWSHALFIRIF